MTRLFAIILFTLLPITAAAFPLPGSQLNAHLRVPLSTAGYDFEGIVALSNCSGSLIQLANGRDSDQALVLTNGHCIGSFPRPGDVVYRRQVSRTFSLLDASGRTKGRISAIELIYATMTDTDMAIYRVRETYGEIRSRFGIRPLVLASGPVSLNQPIEIVSGYWRSGYRCAVEAIVHRLQEGGYEMTESVRYTRPGCEVIGGTSGSPVIAQGLRTVIAVNNTGNESGGRCSMNNPCEIDEDGNVKFERGYSYAQQTFWVYSCLNVDGEIDLNVAGCRLPKGRSLGLIH